MNSTTEKSFYFKFNQVSKFVFESLHTLDSINADMLMIRSSKEYFNLDIIDKIFGCVQSINEVSKFLAQLRQV